VNTFINKLHLQEEGQVPFSVPFRVLFGYLGYLDSKVTRVTKIFGTNQIEEKKVLSGHDARNPPMSVAGSVDNFAMYALVQNQNFYASCFSFSSEKYSE